MKTLIIWGSGYHDYGQGGVHVKSGDRDGCLWPAERTSAWSTPECHLAVVCTFAVCSTFWYLSACLHRAFLSPSDCKSIRYSLVAQDWMDEMNISQEEQEEEEGRSSSSKGIRWSCSWIHRCWHLLTFFGWLTWHLRTSEIKSSLLAPGRWASACMGTVAKVPAWYCLIILVIP